MSSVRRKISTASTSRRPPTRSAKRFTTPPNTSVGFNCQRVAEDWADRRKQVETAFRQSIGLSRLPDRTPLSVRVLRTHDLGDCILENVIFCSRRETPVPANIYRPKVPAGQRLPAVLNVLGHWLGDGKANEQNQILSRKLAQVGFLVMMYDAIGHGERNHPGKIHTITPDTRFSRLAKRSRAGWYGIASGRLITCRAAPDVDPQRIGIVGNSGGGLNTLFTSAIDPRFRAAVVAGYVFRVSVVDE